MVLLNTTCVFSETSSHREELGFVISVLQYSTTYASKLQIIFWGYSDEVCKATMLANLIGTLFLLHIIPIPEVFHYSHTYGEA